MRIFYSGVEVTRRARVEQTLATCDVMMTYHELRKRTNNRFALTLAARGEQDVIIYYSGEGSRSNPEITLGDSSNLMLTYHDMHEKNKPTKRFQAILDEVDVRKKKKKRFNGLSQAQIQGIETGDIPVGVPQSHFLDSGSFTLWTRAETYAKENDCGEWEFYNTDEFWQYMEDYVEFNKAWHKGIDLCANIDVLPFRGRRHAPKKQTSHRLSLRNLKWLEARGLRPIPVVHYKADLQWLQYYMDQGYELIGLGGLVGSSNQDGCKYWIDRAFDMVCDTPDRMPKVKLHGFGVTSYPLLLRYPWYSADSTSWTKVGAYGGILVPHKRKGEFIFSEQPYLVKASYESWTKKPDVLHIMTMNEAERAVVLEWLEYIDVPLGKLPKGWKCGDDKVADEDIVEYGVLTRHTERRVANLLFFEAMRRHVPEYPWPFTSPKQEGFGLI